MESQSIDLKNESNRLSTFDGWPISFIISPKNLAAAGFYYTKQTDKVKCAFCNICICRWEFGDNAVDEHIRHNPNCSFLLSENCGNLPIIEGIQLRGEFVDNHKETGEPIDIRGLGVRAHRVAFHLNYKSYYSRFKTFRGWKNKSQKPEDLAMAGFFFTGSNDEVRCYYCDGGLQNWEEVDNPWVEHAKWFPSCGFLNLVKGDKFLDGSLVDRFNALLSTSRTDNTTSSSQEGQMVSIHQTDISPNNMRSSTNSYETNDHQISELMLLPTAIMALELGLQPSHIRQAIRDNLQDIGRPFRSLDNFIQQILALGQTSFPTNGDLTSLEEILQREESVTNTNNSAPHNDSLSEISNDNSNESHNESDEELEFLLDSELEDELISLNSSSQNRSEDTNVNESAIVTNSICSSQSNDIKVKDEVNISNNEYENTKLSQSDLEEENRRLKEARLCKICLDQELGVVMLPCAHLVACIACASSLPYCPLCRQTIKATVRTFLS